MDMIYQDNRVIVCVKPAGVVSVDEPGGLPDLLRQELGDPTASVRTVHRLDQVVGGAMVLARSREAAKRLSRQVQEHTFHKIYLAVVEGVPEVERGTYRDLLRRSKEERKTYLVPEPGKDVQEAILHYEVLAQNGAYALIRIRLETGRTHQIRAQFSGHGHPVAGDKKYGAIPTEGEGIALWSHEIGFFHPQTGEWMQFVSMPPDRAPWRELLEISSNPVTELP